MKEITVTRKLNKPTNALKTTQHNKILHLLFLRKSLQNASNETPKKREKNELFLKNFFCCCNICFRTELFYPNCSQQSVSSNRKAGVTFFCGCLTRLLKKYWRLSSFHNKTMDLFRILEFTLVQNLWKNFGI